MILSINGREFLKDQEGFRAKAYWDNNGYAIGYGSHTYFAGLPVAKNDTITEPLAMILLLNHIKPIETELNKFKLKQYEFDALVSLIYNIGMGNFKKSTIYKRLNQSEEIIEDHFLRWNKVTKNGKKVASGPLTERRKEEWDLFKHHVYKSDD